MPDLFPHTASHLRRTGCLIDLFERVVEENKDGHDNQEHWDEANTI